MTAPDLHARMPAMADIEEHANVHAALDAAAARAGGTERILAFGSFFVAAAALNWAQRNGYFTA